MMRYEVWSGTTGIDGGRTAIHVPVNCDVNQPETVVVSYVILAELLHRAGWSKDGDVR